MCTVTFIPFQGQVFITSNRDESPSRHASGLRSLHRPDANEIHLPLDETSQGSWIALTHRGRAICLLNGAFEPFIPSPAYRQSRGQVVVDAAYASSIEDFAESYVLEGIAPFTLLLFENETFAELVWDGEKKYITPLSVSQAQLWSSATLYPPEIRAWRRSLFTAWMAEREHVDRDAIIEFHQMKKGDGHNDFIMNRNEIVKTLSVTSILLKENSGSILHLDLEKNTREEILIRYAR